MYDAYVKYVRDFEESEQGKAFMQAKAETDKAWESVEESDEWKAYQGSLRELGELGTEAETALVESDTYKDYLKKKNKYHSLDPKNLNTAIDCQKATLAYNKIWEETKDHEKGMEAFNEVINEDKKEIPRSTVISAIYFLETPFDAFCRSEEEKRRVEK